jgi:probable phosphoglycerate mutase
VSRRRIYLMRHAEVRYFEGLHPDEVGLTERGRAQAEAARDLLAGIGFDRVLTSGLRRTDETARIVAPGAALDALPELREIVSGRIGSIPDDELEEAFVGAFRGAVPEDRPFLGGETVGSLLDRVHGALDELLRDCTWDVVLAVLHGGVNRAILSYALTGRRVFLGGFEQAPGCVNVVDVGDESPDWIVRAVNHTPYDPAHLAAARTTTMEALWQEYLRSR